MLYRDDEVITKEFPKFKEDNDFIEYMFWVNYLVTMAISPLMDKHLVN